MCGDVCRARQAVKQQTEKVTAALQPKRMQLLLDGGRPSELLSYCPCDTQKLHDVAIGFLKQLFV
jgi:hypothetical protein